MYEVGKILEKAEDEDGETLYLCTWKGYDDVSWEPTANLRISAAEILTEFNQSQSKSKNKGKPKRKRVVLIVLNIFCLPFPSD